jgi:hypothetical protein
MERLSVRTLELLSPLRVVEAAAAMRVSVRLQQLEKRRDLRTAQQCHNASEVGYCEAFRFSKSTKNYQSCDGMSCSLIDKELAFGVYL